MTEERSIAWLALEPDTAIVGSDGAEVGKVAEVIADRQKDIFSGVTFTPGLMDSALFIPADLIAHLTDSEVTLTIPAAEASGLEPYEG